MRQLITLFILFLSIGLSSQTLIGKVYDEITTVKGIKITNETQKQVTATDQKGNFSIKANVSDTIVFESLFHDLKAVILTDIHFEDVAVFELKKIINQLNEVEVISESKQPVFEENEYNRNLNTLIAEDIKRNPQKYVPEQAMYGVNFLAVIDLVAKLFKRKSEKYKAKRFEPITYEALDSLTSNSSFFNDKLITKDLKIPIKQKYLFFEFCEAKQLDAQLLLEKNKIYLLEKLVLQSQLFLILLEEYGEKKTIKD